MASNLATNELTWWVLTQHPTIGSSALAYRDLHSAGLAEIAEGMAQRTAEAMEALRFLEALKDLLTTRRLVLVPENASTNYAMPEPERRLGWLAADGGYYLVSEVARKAVEELLGDDGLGNISLRTLHEQLMSLGLIQSHSDGRWTKQVRIDGEIRRVLHLRAKALMTGNDRAEENDDA